ncbi:Calcium-independent phospholipase A2-gamma [Hypsizygus marmoreus]|uniref:Calcium-independent phospholipase A2-gamma n=1 Tax=Hypsizygus marmoreus TaxID=39966 RepID=A0A369JTF6_HYPMA|nr:Calcium-independent phospholipase A2-gamma [Hypsizygus marmoreus]
MSVSHEKDRYTVSTTTGCHVVADCEKVASKIWFDTPALDKEVIDKVVEIQLQTRSCDQGWVTFPGVGSWSWFDLVILESPEATEPKVKDGVALTGPKLTSQHDIFNALEVGNALAVRACAQFVGWENHATEGRLVLRLSDKGRAAQPQPDEFRFEYLGLVTKQISMLEETFDRYLNAATPAEAPPAYSLVRELLPTGPVRADQSAIAGEPPVRVMSLDGGGMTNDPNAKPSKYFQMIAGTSAGGLIAIMLGRLQMTVPECIQAYTRIAAQIFSANAVQKIWNYSKTGAYYTKDNFEKGLKSMIKHTGDEDAPMLDPDTTNQCKVFVVSGQSQDLSHTSAEQFRTYATKFPDTFANCAIWQAARATSAAPMYLPAITINGVEFVDGGLRFNNPSILLMGEVNAVFGVARHIGCFLTIGTGMQPKIKFDEQASNPLEVAQYLKTLAEAAIKVATDCETTHHLMRGLFYGRDDVYWRFNAGVRAGDDWAPMIALDDYEDMSKLVVLTETYLGGEIHRIEQCVVTFAGLNLA